MKKTLYLASLFFLFSAPSMVGAEEMDLSNLSDEELQQEMDKRQAEEMIKEEKEAAKKTTEVYSDKNIKEMDSISMEEFEEKVSEYGLERLRSFYDSYEVKGDDMSETEKEKMRVIEDIIEEQVELNKIYGYVAIGMWIFLFLFLVGSYIFY